MNRELLALTSLLVAIATASCSGRYEIVAPKFQYCPVSDSAKAKADSVPLPCLFPADTSR